jgi:hypothetical protein
VRLVADPFEYSRARATFHDNAHVAVRHLHDLHDFGERAEIENVSGARFFVGFVAL